MTMLALSLSIGILIDDAIVVIENIYRHYEHGMKPRKAAAFGTAEIGLAALAITLSIVAVFVPVAFMDGIVGRFFHQFGLTVACAVLLSLFVAFTLTPMMTARMLHHQGTGGWFYQAVERPLKALERAYGHLLGAALRHRFITIAIAFAAFFGAIGVGSQLKGEFLPTEDQSEFNIKVKAPLGSTLSATEGVFDEIRSQLKNEPWLAYTFTTIGTDDFKRVNEGTMYVKMTPKHSRNVGQLDAMTWARQHLSSVSSRPGMRMSIEGVPRMQGGPGAVDLQIDLRGPDLDGLNAAAQRMVAHMREAGGYTDTSISYETGQPEVHLAVKRDAAADLGVDASTIGNAVRNLIGGYEVAKYKLAGDRYDVRVRLDDGQRNRPDAILDLNVRSHQGSLVPLRNVVDVRPEPGPSRIDRYNRQRQVTISTNLVKTAAPGQRTLVLGPAKEELKRFAAESDLPTGSSIGVIGMAEIMEESNRNMAFALMLAVVMVYLVLASQFEHLIHPFTIMLSLPLSLIGALGLLWLTGSTMSIYTSIGIIMLMGLVTKNAILLVDYTNTLRHRDHMDRTTALLTAGPVRLRPILMTTLAMIAGMAPIALGTGEGSESRSPMAITVIGGLATSTLLTLVVVPAVYSLLDDASIWFMKRFRRSDGHASET
jgi:HAE1 family hydrophobic/amphiphilic exporter-1